MSWKPELKVDGVWISNGLRFATQAEAEQQARATLRRWTALSDARTAPSDDCVNAKYDGLKVVPAVAYVHES